MDFTDPAPTSVSLLYKFELSERLLCHSSLARSIYSPCLSLLLILRPFPRRSSFGGPVSGVSSPPATPDRQLHHRFAPYQWLHKQNTKKTQSPGDPATSLSDSNPLRSIIVPGNLYKTFCVNLMLRAEAETVGFARRYSQLFKNMFFDGYGYHGTSFEQTYRCYPASFIDKPQIENGDKIIMPPSALDRLASLHIDYPMLFELRNAAAERASHCGVLEFIAEEGMIYMPYWMMENLLLQEGDIVRVKNVTLPKGTYVKLQPHTKDFLDISNPKAMTIKECDGEVLIGMMELSPIDLLVRCGFGVADVGKAWGVVVRSLMDFRLVQQR
ncbi:unnamed protein product [Ilex paraguariensis]|uniref:Ubiquitin fusion degradation protein UFD1 N-terminal subdomain 1 domain-containing protein n=1 Tax=Ilex paraguariensis TaxID=185542 RepID=A0ABC8RBM6_9AQUA